ncbi:MAG: M15 family metallopeptidase [Saprospiraceae bacterium]
MYTKQLVFALFVSSLLWLNCDATVKEAERAQEIAVANSTTKQLTLQPTEDPQLVIDSAITLDYIMGKFEPTKHKDFVQVPSKYANGRKDRWLRKETYKAFLEMYEAAKKEGIELKVLSATRNFATQKIIWEGKWTGKRLHESKENLAKTTPDPTDRALKILKWSSMPGTSRHHWGTDMDLNAFTNDFFEKGKGLKMYIWMTANAHKFGFCQPYSPKDAQRPNGYNEEKWHWSYLPLAQKLTQQAELRLKNEMIDGFKGAETAVSIGVVDKFILGINSVCL